MLSYEELYEKYATDVLRVSYFYLGDRQRAEDVCQDVFVRLMTNAPDLQEGREKAWLLKVALNRCRDRRRLKRSAYICELSAELEQCIPAPDDAQCRLDDLALSEAINGFLGALDEEKRNLFLRRYWYLDSISDLARRFAMSESKVKTTLFRCRAQLRAHLEKEGYTL